MPRNRAELRRQPQHNFAVVRIIKEEELYYTEDILRAFITWATKRTLYSLGVTNDDEIDPLVAAEIIAVSPDHTSALLELANAYIAWYSFHLGLERTGEARDLSHDENNELNALIMRRDAAKQAFLAITAT